MANGDDALAAGMDVVSPGDDRRDGYDEINKTRDYGDDALAAGMDVVSPGEDRRDGYDEINKTRDYIAQRTNSVLPIAKGGTGATSAATARTNLGIKSGALHDAEWSVAGDTIVIRGAGGQIGVADPTADHHAVTRGSADDRYLQSGPGGTIEGYLTVEGNFGVDGTGRVDGRFRNDYARANAVTGWLNVGVAADGTIGQTASSAAYKENIEDLNSGGNIDQLQAREFDWIDGGHDVGVVAEEVAAAGYEWLVTRDAQGQVMGVRYEMIALALIPEIQALRARVAQLEAAQE